MLVLNESWLLVGSEGVFEIGLVGGTKDMLRRRRAHLIVMSVFDKSLERLSSGSVVY